MALALIMELEVEDSNAEIQSGAGDLGKSMKEMRANLKGAQKNVDVWKGKSKRARAKGDAADKPPKRMTIESSEEVLAAIGDATFLDKLRDMYHRPGLHIDEWHKYTMNKTKATASEDASLGFYLMARGIATLPPVELERHITEFLGIDIEDQLMQSLDQTLIANLGYEELWDIYKSLDRRGPQNKKHRVELLQHIIQCVENIRFCIGWLRLTDADDVTARAKAIQATYAVKCSQDDPVTEPDYTSNDFKTFCGQFKNFRTGARHIYDAYEAFGSILIICPLMRIKAFHDSRTGVAINNVVKALEAINPLTGVEFETREALHNNILKAIINGLEVSMGLHS
ncbi:hypothetical protein RSAG8_03787, partial [Rhizoctonia solani AG-8 WAC10335]